MFRTHVYTTRCRGRLEEGVWVGGGSSRGLCELGKGSLVLFKVLNGAQVWSRESENKRFERCCIYRLKMLLNIPNSPVKKNSLVT